MKQLFSMCFLWGVFAFVANAQEPVFGANDEYNSTWTMSVDKTTDLQVGDIVTFTFTGTPIPTWHLYSADASGNIAYNPTNLEIFGNEGEGARLKGKITESKKPHEEEDELMGGLIRHFGNGESITFTQKVEITGPRVDMVAQFNSQVCANNDGCVFARFPITWKTTAKVPKNDTAILPQDANSHADTAVPDAADRESKDSLKPTDQAHLVKKEDSAQAKPAAGLAGGPLATFPCNQIHFQPYEIQPVNNYDLGTLLRLFLKAFLAGLMLISVLLILPRIPMIKGIFARRFRTKQQRIRNGVVFSLSAILGFVALGAVLTLIFGISFLSEFSAHGSTNILIFIILLVWALSYFGWIPIYPTQSGQAQINENAQKSGVTSHLFTGLSLLLLSLFCVGQIVGAEIVGVHLEPPPFSRQTILGMAGFGLALAMPIVIFAIFPKWLQRLSNADWVPSAKVISGFIMLAWAIQVFSLADQANRWQLLDRDLFLGIWAVIFIMLGAYLLGKIPFPEAPQTSPVKVPRFIFAMISFGFVLYLVPGMFGKPLTAMEGILPPVTADIGVNIRGGAARPNSSCTITSPHWAEHFRPITDENCWFYDYCEAADYAQRVKKPLFLYFTGHSAGSTRKMEQTVFPSTEIKRHFEENYVLASLWVDDASPLQEPYTNETGEKLYTIRDVLLDFEKGVCASSGQPYFVLMGVKNDTAQVLIPPIGFEEAHSISGFNRFLRLGYEVYHERYK